MVYMNKVILFCFSLLVSLALHANERANGDCMQGGHAVVTNGISSTTRVMQSFVNLTGQVPTSGCTVTVYLTGTATVATLATNSQMSTANPFTADATGHWYFEAANATYDVVLSNAGIGSPFTIGAILLFDPSNGIPTSCGGDTDILYNKAGVLACDGGLTWNYTSQYLTLNSEWQFGGSSTTFTLTDIAAGVTLLQAPTGGNFNINPASGTVMVNGKNAVPGLATTGGAFIQSSGGFQSVANSYQGYTSTTDGAFLRGFTLAQNTNNLNGGYLLVNNITYNPYDSPNQCMDIYGNPVQQPLPLNGATFAAHTNILWGGLSPLMPANGSCGVPLPVDLDYGLFLNNYFYARGGLDTDQVTYNAIQALQGGVIAQSLLASRAYPAGTQVNATTCAGLGAACSGGALTQVEYLGGYTQIGVSNGPPSGCGNPLGSLACTIATVTNPLTVDDGIEVGTMYWDTALNCVNVYGPSSWNCLGTGGSGSPGGMTSDVQYNSSGAFAGSSSFTFTTSGHVQMNLVGTANADLTLFVGPGYVQSEGGFNACADTMSCTTAASYTQIQAPTGGVYAQSFRAINYSQVGNSNGVPALTTSDAFQAGGLYYDTGTLCSGGSGLRVFNGSTWSCVGTGGGGGSPGLPFNSVQFNSSGTFGGSSNLLWSNSAQQMNIIGTANTALTLFVGPGYVQSEGGFNACADTSGCTTAASYAQIQAPTGGVYAKSGRFINYVQSGNFSGAAPPLTTSDTLQAGALSYSLTSACEQVYNGSSWACVGGGGGGGSPGGVNLDVQFNNGGTFGGSGGTNFIWNNTAQQLNVVGKASALTLFVGAGYLQSEGGLLAEPNSLGVLPYTAIQAPTGGVYAKSLRAINYTQTGFASTTPPLTTSDSYQPGAMFYNTSAACEEVFNGASFSCLASASGGVTAVNTFTGSVSIIGTANQIAVTNAANTITIALPATPIVTGGFDAGQTIQSTYASSGSGCTGNIAFQAGSGTMDIYANGSVCGQIFNSTTFEIGGTTVVDASRNATFNSVTSPNTIQSTITGGGVAFQAGSGTLQILGNGNINTAGAIVTAGNITAGSGSDAAAMIAGGNVESGISGVGGFVVNGAFGITATIVNGSCTINVAGGIIYGHSGC